MHDDTDDAIVIARIVAQLLDAIRRKRQAPEQFFGGLIRTALDEVIDGPRTGRVALAELEKTEKTYVGTKMEIVTRAALEFPRGTGADCSIAGHDVDIKWSQDDGAWMIAPENVGGPCLGLCLNNGERAFSIGVFVPRPALLGRPNRDGKASLNAAARRASVRWIVRRGALPENFLARFSPQSLAYIMAGPTAQERVRRLAALSQGQFIPRLAIATVAMTADPMRRARSDAYNFEGLDGVRLLGTKYRKAQIRATGYRGPMPADCWYSVPFDLDLS